MLIASTTNAKTGEFAPPAFAIIHLSSESAARFLARIRFGRKLRETDPEIDTIGGTGITAAYYRDFPHGLLTIEERQTIVEGGGVVAINPLLLTETRKRSLDELEEVTMLDRDSVNVRRETVIFKAFLDGGLDIFETSEVPHAALLAAADGKDSWN